jgi:hypothetical protein
MGLIFGRIGRHMKTARLSAKIPYARFWRKNRPSHSCSAGHLGYKRKFKQMFDKAQFQNQNLNHNIKRKIRPPRTQSAGQLYHMELNLSSVIFSSNCTKKSVPQWRTLLLIHPGRWSLSTTDPFLLYTAQQFPIHGRGRR